MTHLSSVSFSSLVQVSKRRLSQLPSFLLAGRYRARHQNPLLFSLTGNKCAQQTMKDVLRKRAFCGAEEDRGVGPFVRQVRNFIDFPRFVVVGALRVLLEGIMPLPSSLQRRRVGFVSSYKYAFFVVSSSFLTMSSSSIRAASRSENTICLPRTLLRRRAGTSQSRGVLTRRS